MGIACSTLSCPILWHRKSAPSSTPERRPFVTVSVDSTVGCGELTALAALRFIKACLRTGNHFIHRSFMKNGVTKAILDLVDRETGRDTMLSSACLDTLELIRKVRLVVAYARR